MPRLWVKIKKQIVYGKEYTHTTRCTSPRHVECEFKGVCRPRDDPACLNIMMCGMYELNALASHGNLKEMSLLDKFKIRVGARPKLLTFRVGRHMATAETIRYQAATQIE